MEFRDALAEEVIVDVAAVAAAEDDLEALSKVDADIDIFQIDDGFQTATGDWLSVDPVKFPNGMKAEVEKRPGACGAR